METVTIREMKAQWAEIERRTRDGEEFLVLNRGRPVARILPAPPRKVLHWEDHLATAVVGRGRLAEEVVRADRDGRW